jgi:hypothetical protein
MYEEEVMAQFVVRAQYFPARPPEFTRVGYRMYFQLVIRINSYDVSNHY